MFDLIENRWHMMMIWWRTDKLNSLRLILPCDRTHTVATRLSVIISVVPETRNVRREVLKILSIRQSFSAIVKNLCFARVLCDRFSKRKSIFFKCKIFLFLWRQLKSWLILKKNWIFDEFLTIFLFEINKKLFMYDFLLLTNFTPNYNNVADTLRTVQNPHCGC